MGFVHIANIVSQGPRQSEEELRLLRSAWPSIVGDHAPRIVPVAIHGGTLSLRVEGREGNAYVRRERREMIKKINAFLGEGVVTRLTWVEGSARPSRPVLSEPPEPDTESLEIASVIRDDDLRAKFIRLLSRHQEQR